MPNPKGEPDWWRSWNGKPPQRPRQTDLKAIKTIRAVVKDGAVHYPAEVYLHFGIRPFGTAPRVTLPEAP